MVTSADKPWLGSYPKQVPQEVNLSTHQSLDGLLVQCFKDHLDDTAFSFMGRDYSYRAVEEESLAFASYLQSLGLKKGDRVALMMVNIPQYPIAMAGVLRAGMILVNVNPQYTAHELEHQLIDSGAKALVVLENFAFTAEQCLKQAGSKINLEKIVIARVGGKLGMVKGSLVRFALKYIKKAVPDYDLPNSIIFRDAVAIGAKHPYTNPHNTTSDVAVFQYTGGTTGTPKGAQLTHGNLIANIEQCYEWCQPVYDSPRLAKGAQFTTVASLPLYHVFAFTVCMMLSIRMGGRCILIPNPRDLPAMFKELSNERYTIHAFSAVNTLFNAMVEHEDFDSVNWQNLVVSLGGGMAVQRAVAAAWLERTGCPICEGYGLSETSPVASCNRADSTEFTGTIGVPLPSTILKCVDDEENEVPLGEAGEIVISGPQVMLGYHNAPEKNAQSFTKDGFFKTGDIGVMDDKGFFKIVDRKKDMISVSGLKVYPNEVEDIVVEMPEVSECAVVGVPDEHSGEAVKLYIVRNTPELSQVQVMVHCDKNLTRYKQPKYIEFVDELPKSNVGKILRRKLRDKAAAELDTSKRLKSIKAQQEELEAQQQG